MPSLSPAKARVLHMIRASWRFTVKIRASDGKVYIATLTSDRALPVNIRPNTATALINSGLVAKPCIYNTVHSQPYKGDVFTTHDLVITPLGMMAISRKDKRATIKNCNKEMNPKTVPIAFYKNRRAI